MEELAVELQGQAKLAKVNVDDEGELAMQFGVTGIPALLLFKDGKLLDNMVSCEIVPVPTKKIKWSLNKTPLEVVAGNKGVSDLKVKDNATGVEEILETEGIFVAIGHKPNTDFLGGQRNR